MNDDIITANSVLENSDFINNMYIVANHWYPSRNISSPEYIGNQIGKMSNKLTREQYLSLTYKLYGQRKIDPNSVDYEKIRNIIVSTLHSSFGKSRTSV